MRPRKNDTAPPSSRLQARLSRLLGRTPSPSDADSAKPNSAVALLSSPTSCPVCRAEVYQSIPAKIAPFLRMRCEIPESVQATSNFCYRCHHVFFTPLLTPEQMSRLYEGYRNAEYDRQRIALEPEYEAIALAHRESTGADDDHRVRGYIHRFADYRDLSGIVVDFGGGNGKFTREVFTKAEIIVIEAGDGRTQEEVDQILSRASMLFCAHVFEHLPKSGDILSGLVAAMPAQSLVYIEVPKDYPNEMPGAFLDLYYRSARGEELGWHQLLWMHEHIAYFGEKSVAALLSRAGAPVVHRYDVPTAIMMMGAKP